MILLLIPVSVLVIGFAIAAFLWAVDNGQYEDASRDGDIVLFEDTPDPIVQSDPSAS
ncbi:MAG: cbb3-type cytochrome oxidase assembly protein CcoS [Gammaproteobacteria bacterium]|nr:cbb3-type cytochrome oxidase assembly protein CcoS [Gammaproteobacteria bacterium]